MNNQKPAADRTDEMMVAIIAALIMFVVFGPIVAKFARPYYNQAVVGMATVLLVPISLFSNEASDLKAKIKTINPKNLTPKQVTIIWHYVSGFYKWLTGALLIILLIKVWRNNLSEKFSRTMDMWSLLKNNVKDYPCLAPILKTGPITNQSQNDGPWAVARSPIQFVVEHGLLLNHAEQEYKVDEVLDKNCIAMADSKAFINGETNSLNYKTLVQLFEMQLGAQFEGDLKLLTNHQKGLALALLAHGHDDKINAFKAFNQMSLTWNKDDLSVNISGVDELLSKFSTDFEALNCHKTYVNVWFAALLDWARKKGALPNSLWIWLRPTDRTLFYALNQVGGRTAWVEASGVWSHFLAEEKSGHTLKEANLQTAIAGLEEALAIEGWLKTKTKTENKVETKAEEPEKSESFADEEADEEDFKVPSEVVHEPHDEELPENPADYFSSDGE
ncbi:MAG: hypothetical protein ACRCTY_05075 [Candidatus Adiutrix sp.]